MEHHAIKICVRSGGINTFLTRWKCVVGFTLRLFYFWRSFQVHIGGWVDPGVGLDAVAKRDLLASVGFQTLIQSLYRPICEDIKQIGRRFVVWDS